MLARNSLDKSPPPFRGELRFSLRLKWRTIGSNVDHQKPSIFFPLSMVKVFLA